MTNSPPVSASPLQDAFDHNIHMANDYKRHRDSCSTCTEETLCTDARSLYVAYRDSVVLYRLALRDAGLLDF